MSWCNRRTLLAGAAAVALGACGFTPVYAPGGAGAALDGAVTLDTPQTSNGFTLRQRLQEQLGPDRAPQYTLSVQISTSTSRVAITQQQDTDRYNVIGRAAYMLKDIRSDAVVTSGTVDSFTSYAATGTTVATLASERDAYRRLMIILADAITDRLLVSVPDTAIEPAQDNGA